MAQYGRRQWKERNGLSWYLSLVAIIQAMITGQVKGDQWIFAKKPYCLVILLHTAWTITVSQHPSGRKDVTRWEDPSLQLEKLMKTDSFCKTDP